MLDIIRRVHHQLGLGVRRLHAYLTQAGLISCSVSSVYRVIKRAGALVHRPRKPKPVWTRYARALLGDGIEAIAFDEALGQAERH